MGNGSNPIPNGQPRGEVVRFPSSNESGWEKEKEENILSKKKKKKDKKD